MTYGDTSHLKTDSEEMIMGDHAVLMTGYVRYSEYERGRKNRFVINMLILKKEVLIALQLISVCRNNPKQMVLIVQKY